MDSRSFVDDCSAEALTSIYRYPKHLKAKKDEEILPVILAGDRTMVTCDVAIIEDHLGSVPEVNSGIVVLRLRRSVRTMTVNIAKSLLASFKKKMPLWYEQNLANIYLEICETQVVVSRLPYDGKKKVIDYDDNFVAAFVATINHLQKRDVSLLSKDIQL